MNREQLLSAVEAARTSGICVVPPAQDGSKRPDVGSWRSFQLVPPDAALLKRWYSNGRTGIGWVTGKVSGGLEVIDFDDRETYAEYKAAAVEAGLGELIERIEAGYLEHSPNGVHWPYYCDEVSGNKKLAMRKTGQQAFKSLIETRGEGGYIVVAPSYGGVHPSGAYKRVKGAVSAISRISPEERRQLHVLAKLFDESPKREEPTRVVSYEDGRPGDAFASATSWGQILEPHGWCVVYKQGETTNWRRPGKKQGISATTNHGGSDLLYVFSTSTPFESERGINKFSAYATLEHGGDFAEAARALREQGHGEPETTVDLSGILEQVCPQAAEATPPSFPQDLLKVPGLVGEMASYINARSYKAQPILSLGASIAAVATITGRKVCTEDDVRTNVYILGVAETGAGKESGRDGIRKAFRAAGAFGRVALDDMASDSAINTALSEVPSCLLLLDEIGRALKQMNSGRAPPHIAKQVDTFLKLYSASDGTYCGKNYAQSEQKVSIEQPNFSIYGTTVPGRLYESMHSDQIKDGLLSRFLIFESESKNPRSTKVPKAKKIPPASLVDGLVRWEKTLENTNPEAGNLEMVQVPDPKAVKYTPEAEKVFDRLDDEIWELTEEKQNKGDDAGLFTRVTLAAKKLALIRAAGCFANEITEADAVWGMRLARHCYEHLAYRVGENLADNQQEANTKRAGEIIRKAGRNGLTRRQLTRKTQWLKGQERNDIIKTLEESGQIVAETKAGKTKPAVVVRWVGHF